MSVHFSLPPFAIVIDTSQYAGNFERQMCAYITGIAGDCGVGQKLAEKAEKELPKFAKTWFDNNIISVTDDRGYFRNCSIWPNPKWFNDGRGNHWKDGHDLDEVKAKRDETIRNYYTTLINQWKAKLEILEGKVQNIPHVLISSSAKDCQKQVVKLEEEMMYHISRPIVKYPAYMSVAFFSNSKPTKRVWGVIKERAHDYAATQSGYHESGSIDGFRLIQIEVKMTELKLSVAPDNKLV